MGIFDDLPAPKAAERPPAPATAARTDVDEQHQREERPEKRQRVASGPSGGDGDGVQQQRAPDDGAAPPGDGPEEQEEQQQQPPAMPADQVGPALLKIASHISKPPKFTKASGLLRQLIASGALSAAHRAPLFAALRAAFADPNAANDPGLRRDYRRLLNAFTNGLPPDVLSPAQGAHFEVYGIWVVQRGELATDDSFAFNKAVSRLKEDIAALGPASEEEEAAARGLELPAGTRVPGAAAAAAAAAPVGAAGRSAAAGGAAAGEVEEGEADPFGLDEFMRREEEEERRKQREAAAAAAAGPAAADEWAADAPWGPAELSVMRRQALLDCVAAAKAMHKLAWARTSVEMLVEAAHGCLGNFVAPQRAALEDLMRWVKAERAARRSGAARSAAGGKEMTAFEKARAEWSTATVSKYGKVGAGGDAKSTHWLG